MFLMVAGLLGLGLYDNSEVTHRIFPKQKSLSLKEKIVYITISTMLMAFAVYSLLYISKFRVVLYADSIELLNVRGVYRLERSDITHFQKVIYTGKASGMASIILFSNRSTLKKLEIPLLFEPDEIFQDWIASYPNISNKK
ncbi:MAG: hypothetical protein ACXWRE_15950 [Pseudobdellovibrionaceae bacterium]